MSARKGVTSGLPVGTSVAGSTAVNRQDVRNSGPWSIPSSPSGGPA